MSRRHPGGRRPRVWIAASAHWTTAVLLRNQEQELTQRSIGAGHRAVSGAPESAWSACTRRSQAALTISRRSVRVPHRPCVCVLRETPCASGVARTHDKATRLSGAELSRCGRARTRDPPMTSTNAASRSGSVNGSTPSPHPWPSLAIPGRTAGSSRRSPVLRVDRSSRSPTCCASSIYRAPTWASGLSTERASMGAPVVGAGPVQLVPRGTTG